MFLQELILLSSYLKSSTISVSPGARRPMRVMMGYLSLNVKARQSNTMMRSAAAESCAALLRKAARKTGGFRSWWEASVGSKAGHSESTNDE